MIRDKPKIFKSILKGINNFNFSLYVFLRASIAIKITTSMKVMIISFEVRRLGLNNSSIRQYQDKKKAGSEDPALIKLI